MNLWNQVKMSVVDRQGKLEIAVRNGGLRVMIEKEMNPFEDD